MAANITKALDLAQAHGRAARAVGAEKWNPHADGLLAIAWLNGWHERDGCPVCGYARMECACPVADPFAKEPADAR